MSRRILKACAYNDSRYYYNRLMEKPLISVPPQIDKITGLNLSEILTYYISKDFADKYYKKIKLNFEDINNIINNCIKTKDQISKDGYEILDIKNPMNKTEEDKRKIKNNIFYLFSINSIKDIFYISTINLSFNTIFDKNINECDMFELNLEIDGEFSRTRTNYLRNILDTCKKYELLIIEHMIEDEEEKQDLYIDDAIISKAMKKFLNDLILDTLDKKMSEIEKFIRLVFVKSGPIKVIHEE
ncbi:MAG: hypothetical protein QXD48_02145 [Candidatus Aenigmatarchaeota archaeon]